MELIRSLSARIEELKEDFAFFSYGDVEDIPVLETEVLGHPCL
jgi:hypothetical protein